MPNPPEKICFVIGPIGKPDSDDRIRSDQILEHVITPVVEKCGYSALRADLIASPGIITTQIIQHVINDPLVIADLTGRNPNVYYELAVRHAVRKPIVQIIQLGEPIPFDLEPTRTISIDHHDLTSVNRCMEELEKQIHAVEEDSNQVDNPISSTIDLLAYRQSDNPAAQSNAEIISMIQGLKDTVIDIGTSNKNIVDNLASDILRSFEYTILESHHSPSQFKKLREYFEDLRYNLQVVASSDPIITDPDLFVEENQAFMNAIKIIKAIVRDLGMPSELISRFDTIL